MEVKAKFEMRSLEGEEEEKCCRHKNEEKNDLPFRVKFCDDMLNIHSPLFYDNEQTNEFYFCARWKKEAGGKDEVMRRWK